MAILTLAVVIQFILIVLLCAGMTILTSKFDTVIKIVSSLNEMVESNHKLIYSLQQQVDTQYEAINFLRRKWQDKQ